jgi:hypothetical protein
MRNRNANRGCKARQPPGIQISSRFERLDFRNRQARRHGNIFERVPARSSSVAELGGNTAEKLIGADKYVHF